MANWRNSFSTRSDHSVGAIKQCKVSALVGDFREALANLDWAERLLTSMRLQIQARQSKAKGERNAKKALRGDKEEQ